MAQEMKYSKATELGLGGALINWDRVSITSFERQQGDYLYNMKVNHLLGGLSLYVAQEISPWFYLDLQGALGLARAASGKSEFVLHGGPGLQLRATPLFKVKYVEPYLRAGVHYLHKNFAAYTSGTFTDDPTGKAHWNSYNTWYKGDATGADRHYAIPIALGAGVQSWFSDRFGLGIQGDYMLSIQRDMPNFAQVTARFMWRIGGDSKQRTPQVVERVIEKIVERPVERIVEREVAAKMETIYTLFDNVYFEFDSHLIMLQSVEVIDRIVEVLKQMPDKRFLITGYTDAKGSFAYNKALSERRAQTIYTALTERGIDANQLRYRGVGKAVAAVSGQEMDHVRLGDRKSVV